MKLVKRSSFGWGAARASYAPCNQGLVIHYDGGNTGLARKPHSACVTYWKNTRKFHMNGNGWADIGYSYGACPHGYVFEGRGWQKNQAAQPGGNTTWTSCTLMSGPAENPTEAQINAVRELNVYLQKKDLKERFRGHRDFFATACPGTKLYAMVKDGTFAKSPGKITTPENEDDVPKYVNASGSLKGLKPGVWAAGNTKDSHWKKAYGHVLDASKKNIQYAADVYVQCVAEPGTEVQMKLVEVNRNHYSQIKESKIVGEAVATEGTSFMHFNARGYLQKGRQLQFRFTHYQKNGEPIDLKVNPVVHYWEV